MKTVQKNPWKVESIQDFSCLKCPECAFFTKEENYFENHAIKKHLLSAVFFNEKSSHEIEDKVKDKVQVDVNHVDIDNIKKEPTDLENSEYDPLDFSDTNTEQKEEQLLSSHIKTDLLVDGSNFENPPEKLKIEAIEFDTQDIHKHVDVVDSVKEHWGFPRGMGSENLSGALKEQGPLYPHGIPIPDAQIHFIPEKKPKKRQRKQKFAEVTNDEQWKGGHFMDSLIEYDSSINESSLNHVNEPKKLKMEPRNVDKPDNSQMDRKKPKDQNDLLEIQVPFISDKKPKKRERKQQISKRTGFEEEKEEPIPTEIKLHTVERLPQLPAIASKNYQKYQYQCEECGEKFDGENGKKNYKSHWKTNHSQFLPTSQTSEELVKQMSLKDCPPEFPCSLCEYLTSSETDFKDHIVSVHYKKDGEIHACSLCDFTENNISKFNNHLKMHKHYQCVGCENEFHGTSGKTLFKMHLEKTKSQKTCDGKYIMHCDMCNSRFEEENIFKTHLLSEHEVNEKQIYNCAKCDFQTESVPYLIRHLKSHYKCHLCGKKFHGIQGLRDFKRHIVSHQQKYPRVPKPKISFKSSRKIVKDMPYDCSICGKGFQFLSYFNRHGCITKQHLNHFESADKNFVKVEK